MIPWRINPVSILAAAISLIGAFLPWWGFDVSGISINQEHRWTIWNPPPIQHTSSRRDNGLLELYCFQCFSLGPSARGYSSGRCRQPYPSQTLPTGRTSSLSSCTGRLRCRGKLRHNELLSLSFLRFWTSWS